MEILYLKSVRSCKSLKSLTFNILPSQCCRSFIFNSFRSYTLFSLESTVKAFDELGVDFVGSSGDDETVFEDFRPGEWHNHDNDNDNDDDKNT